MALNFAHTHVRNFGRIFANQPRLLTRHPYLNFLRHYRRLNPKHNFAQLMQEGARTWRALKPEERELYKQQEMLKHLRKRGTLPSDLRGFPNRLTRFGYRRRSMNAETNIQRSLRHRNLLPPPHVRRFLDMNFSK